MFYLNGGFGEGATNFLNEIEYRNGNKNAVTQAVVPEPGIFFYVHYVSFFHCRYNLFNQIIQEWLLCFSTTYCTKDRDYRVV